MLQIKIRKVKAIWSRMTVSINNWKRRESDSQTWAETPAYLQVQQPGLQKERSFRQGHLRRLPYIPAANRSFPPGESPRIQFSRLSGMRRKEGYRAGYTMNCRSGWPITPTTSKEAGSPKTRQGWYSGNNSPFQGGGLCNRHGRRGIEWKDHQTPALHSEAWFPHMVSSRRL